MTHYIPPIKILEGIHPLHPPVVDAYVKSFKFRFDTLQQLS